MADLLQELYEKYETLSNAKDKVSERSSEYLECINGTKGGPKEKKLAAQIISKFFKHFPALQDQALNAVLDLCEDTDSDIRISAMKVLPLLCKDNKEHVMNIASILSQLLQLEDQDYTIACNSLIQVFKEDQINAIKGILSSVQSSGEDGLREKVVAFLYNKLAKLQTASTSTEIEQLLIEEGKKILQDCTSEEYMVVLPYLIKSKLARTSQGQQELINLVAEKIEINDKFDPLEEGTHNTDRLILCVESILPLFNIHTESTKFIVYYAVQVLPQWAAIQTLKDSTQIQLRLLRQLAVLSPYCGNIENINEVLEKIFEHLKELMPLPPENVDVTKVPNLDFTSVECLLYAFHQLARKSPEFLTNDPERLKDFRLRLQYFARGVQGCKRGLENTIHSKKELTEENIEKVKLAPAVLDNINTIIKDLFYQPPLYKCNVRLSFKNENIKKILHADKSPGAQKRHVPITFDSSNGTNLKQTRTNKAGEDRKLYQPPSGKFSSNFGRTSTRGTWSKGGGIRGQRGNRGGARNWRN